MKIENCTLGLSLSYSQWIQSAQHKIMWKIDINWTQMDRDLTINWCYAIPCINSLWIGIENCQRKSECVLTFNQIYLHGFVAIYAVCFDTTPQYQIAANKYEQNGVSLKNTSNKISTHKIKSINWRLLTFLSPRSCRISCLRGGTFGWSEYTKFLIEPRNLGSYITLGRANNVNFELYLLGIEIKTKHMIYLYCKCCDGVFVCIYRAVV